MYCNHCGSFLSDSNDRCPTCGMPRAIESNTMFVQKRSALTLSLKEVFSDVFKRGNLKEGEKLFITGTEFTTPPESEIVASWTKPWLFSRVFMYSAIIFAIFSVMLLNLGYQMLLPGVMLIGAFAVPLSVMIFFWETNAPRNIPFYTIIKIFFVGGALSLLLTAIIQIVDFTQISGTALWAALAEEPAKLLAAAYFIKKINPKYILNGILIGAAVGAGFAAFESAGYAMMQPDVSSMFTNIMLRAILAPGGHVVWAAISGGALVLAKKDFPLQGKIFIDPLFLKFFAVPVILHVIWNSELSLFRLPYWLGGDVVQILLVIAAWFVVLSVLNLGLKQISYFRPANHVVSPSATHGSPVLSCVRGPLKGQAYRLNGTVTLGRDSKLCNVIFPANTPGISRSHCSLSINNGHLTLVDNQSSNGTFLANGTRITSPTPLLRGDAFFLGSKENLFEVQ